ncbi:MAG: hypothetical protein KIT27_00600 [Legionellales bacterium]|nr:hypothetical protein [Legionellales bacterium]
MSAVEWLPFISPFVWILLVINGLALLPLKLKVRLPARVKLTLVFCMITLIGWLLALITVHVMTPAIRVNLLAFSKLLLIPSLILLGITLIRHLMQGNNLLVTLLKIAGKGLRPILHFIALISPAILHIITGAYSKYANEKYEDDRREGECKKSVHHHINSEGEYAPYDDINYKF